MRASVYNLTFRDKERFLTLFSHGVLRITASLLATIILFAIIYFSLYFLNVIPFNFVSFLGHLAASIFIGVIAAYLKLLEYRLEMISYKESNIHDIIPNFIYMFILAIIILYGMAYYIISVDVNSLRAENIATLFILVLLGSIIFAYMLSSSWSWLYTSFLNLISPIDWIAKFDEDAFYRLLPLKFYESKRYHVPLTLGLVDILNYDEILKKLGRKRMQKFMVELMDEINASLRFVDLVARIDDSRKISIIMNIPSASAHIPIQRVLEIIKSFGAKKGINIEAKGRIVPFSPDMISEMDMLKAEGEEVKLS
jgi:GGDEF domain-containing protein